MTAVTVPRWLDRSAAWAWRLLLIGAVAAGAIWLLARLWLVLVPVVIAILLARILTRPVDALQGRGMRRGLAAGAALFVFLVTLASVTTLVGVAVAEEFHEVGPTLTAAVDDIEEWLVDAAGSTSTALPSSAFAATSATSSTRHFADRGTTSSPAPSWPPSF